MQDLIDKAQRLYDASKVFPERDPAAMLALIELRNLVPEMIDELQRAREFRELVESEVDDYPY